jgi:phage internal scaffolding protein
MDMPFVRNPFNYDLVAASDFSAVGDFGATLTQQHQADEADINTIVRRFGLTGKLPENVVAPTYADFTEVYDFHSAQNAIRGANESFMAMPADVRFRFHNDPGAFVAFCSDPANLDEMGKLGLLRPSERDSAVNSGLPMSVPTPTVSSSPDASTAVVPT